MAKYQAPELVGVFSSGAEALAGVQEVLAGINGSRVCVVLATLDRAKVSKKGRPTFHAYTHASPIIDQPGKFLRIRFGAGIESPTDKAAGVSLGSFEIEIDEESAE